MNLTCAQRTLLRETIEPLLVYANSRMGIIRQLKDPDEPDRQLQEGIVARALWQHTELIEDYVREKEDQLPGPQLDVARDLEGVLYDDYLFEGVEQGRAVFLHETGVYHAVGLDEDTLAQLPATPTLLRMALVPFQGLIVPMLPLVSIGVPSETDRRSLREGAEETDGARITDGGELAARATAFRPIWKARRAHEADRQDHEVAGPGRGYHQGALQGLSGQERADALRAHRDRLARQSEGFHTSMAERSIRVERPPLTLEEGLSLLDDDWLESVAGTLGDVDCTASVPRATLVRRVCERLSRDRDLRDTALEWCDDTQFDLIRRLATTNPLSLDCLTPSQMSELLPLVPLFFVLQEEGSYAVWMPPEIRALVSEVDLEEVARTRARMAQLRHAADALASMCGIIGVRQAHERYQAIADEPLEFEAFLHALARLETSESRDSYALWEHDGELYLICSEIADASAVAHVVRTSYADRIKGAEPMGQGRAATGVVELEDEDEEEFGERLDVELERLERQRLALLQQLPPDEPHPLVPPMLEQGFMAYLLESEALRSVRDYVDAHLPDDEDDYEFPELFARAVVVSALFESDPYEGVLDLIQLFGMRRCEGERYPHTLGRLLTNAFNAVPRWELRGWSLEENTERLTGRKRRYRTDGTLIE